ncbi:GxxExxY protein [bacterium]|jgi:hypothetical protein|nr:GxxExxY protein [bacterium]
MYIDSKTKNAVLDNEFIYKNEAYKILGACFEVYNELGTGFLEAIYQECLRIEFSKRKVPFIEKPSLTVKYKGEQLKQKYEPDFICFDEVIVEIKAVKSIAEEHKAQIHNYLKVTGKRLGFLINFGSYPGIEYQRIIR